MTSAKPVLHGQAAVRLSPALLSSFPVPILRASCIWLVMWSIASALDGAFAQSQTCLPDQGLLATTQPTPHPEVHPERDRLVRQLLAKNSFEVLTFGDSIMEGWPPDLLQAALHTPVLNVGFGRDGTQQVLWRLDNYDWSKQSPRIVVILVGTNDLRYSVCDVILGVRKVVEVVHTRFVNARLFVFGILPRGRNLRTHEQEILRINSELAKEAGRGHYRFIDAHDGFTCDYVTPCALFQGNNLHLTRRGYEVLSEYLTRALAGVP
jgi:lysophospholipase L1-like esterase